MDIQCERCGKCCDTYSFWLGKNRLADDDKLEIARLIKYHGCEPVKNEKTGELGIRIPITCEHLDLQDGKAVCKIYETRPVVCKNYFCKKVIEKAIKKYGVHI